MIRVYGTSDPEIQDTIRRFKMADVAKNPIPWKLIFNKGRVQHFTYDGRKIRTVAVYAKVADEKVELGYMEQSMVEYLEKNKLKVVPIYRGGDIIVKGFKEGKKLFSYEPLKITKKDIMEEPFKVIGQINFVAATLLQENVSLEMEQKLFGLAFEIEGKKPVIKRLKNPVIKS